MNGIKETSIQMKMQLVNLFGISESENKVIDAILPDVETFLSDSFPLYNNKYFSPKNLNSFHNAQYCMFLYRISNCISKKYPEQQVLCSKIYNLLKMFSGADLFYGVDLPDIFFMDHPVGTVMGRGVFDNYFSFLQGCTIGNNNSVYPKLGKFVSMLSNSKILGKCNIGNRVVISANTYVKDMDIPDNSLVFCTVQNSNAGTNSGVHEVGGGGVLIKQYPIDKMKRYFENIWDFGNETVRNDYFVDA